MTGGRENPGSGRQTIGRFLNYNQGRLVELAGFEPAASSLRKMRSTAVNRGNGPAWWVCGAAVGERREMT